MLQFLRTCGPRGDGAMDGALVCGLGSNPANGKLLNISKYVLFLSSGQKNGTENDNCTVLCFQVDKK